MPGNYTRYVRYSTLDASDRAFVAAEVPVAGAAFLLTMASSRDSSANFRRASVSKTVLETTFERFDADKGGLGLWRPAAWSARTHAPARC